MSKQWPPRITCDFPAIFNILLEEGRLMVLPMAGHMDRIFKRAIELGDKELLDELESMGIHEAEGKDAD